MQKCFCTLVLALLLATSLVPAFPVGAVASSTASPGALQPSHGANGFRHDISALRPWLERYGTAVVFAAIFVEGVGIPAPGLTFLVAATVEATAGVGPRLDFVLFGAFLSAMVGNLLGYVAGRFGGRALLRRLRVDERRLAPLARGFRKYGGWFILVARFVDGPKQLNGIAAGMLSMPLRVFTVFNALGAALWVGVFGLGTYYVTEHARAARDLLGHLNPWLAGATGLALLAALWWLLGRGHRKPRPPENS